MKYLFRGSLLLFTAIAPSIAPAVVVGPYTTDANTVFLFHLDEAALATTAANAPGSIAAGTNAIAYKQISASSANAPLDATILGAAGASGFAFGNFGNAASITNPVAAGVVSNGIGVDMNLNGAFNLNNGNSPNNGDSLANSSLILGPNNSFTLEALINVADTNGNKEIICSDSGQTRSFQFRLSGPNLELNSQPGVNAIANDFLVAIPKTGPHGFVPNTWFHVALVHSEVGTPTNIIYWTSLNDSFTSANAVITNTTATINAAAPLILDIGNEARATGGSTEGLRGMIDEVRISRGVRGADQMMFSDGAITISHQPQPEIVAPGATAIFTVTASSPISSWAPLHYQWRSNGVELVDGGDFSGATTAMLTIANGQTAYQADYDVVITNIYQTNISSTASLTVHAPLNLAWRANIDFNWDTATSNWFDTVNVVNSAFTGGDFVTFDDSGNNASPITLVGSLLPGSVTVNSTLPYSFAGNGKISGGSGLIKLNSGTLTIQTTNDYAGVTTLGGGTVSVSNLANGLSPSAIGAASSASANLVLDGGTLQYTGPTVSANRGATLNAGGGTIEITTAGNSLALGGAIVGSSGGNLTKAGSGTLALTGANTYNGATIINAGTVQLSSSGTFGAGNVTNNGSLLFSGTRTVANAITGTGNLTNDSTGTLTLSGANTYSGQTVINGPSAGGLVVANSSALGNCPLVTVVSTTGGALGGTRVTLNSGVSVPSLTALSLPGTNNVRSTLFAAGPSSWNGPITLVGDNVVSPGDQVAFAGSGGSLTIGGGITGINFPGTLQLRGDGSGNGGVGGRINGIITLAGTATVQVNDGVTWTIAAGGGPSSVNSWGITEIAKGTLQLGAAHALPDGTTVKFGAAGNATLDLAGLNQQVAGLVSVANVDIIGNSSTTSDSILFYSTNGGSSTFGGSIVDALGSGTQRTLLFIQSGVLLLTGSNSYSGSTVVGGTLALGANGSIDNTRVLGIAPNGTFDVSAITSYNLSTNTALSASGPFFLAPNPPAIIGGNSVNLGSQSISFQYNGSLPLLSVAQGTLSLNSNPITVNGSALSAGSYVLLHQATGSINNSGSFPEAIGTAITAGTTNYISINGGDLVLNILNVSTTTVTRTIGTSPSTYGTPLRFHAVVTPAPADGETISFFSGVMLIGTATTTGGAADLDITNLPASALVQEITASYPGDSLNTASTGTLAGGQLVNPASVTPSVAVANKTYDGTTTATITGRSLAGVFGSDDVNLGSSGAATFASANVGTGVSVSVSGLALGGTTAGNYILSSTSISTNADITAATLTYTADSTNRPYGAANPTFTGTVTGFVNGENQAGATTGTLTFASPATVASAPGSYAIDGSGLAANNGNYVFVQAAANATALIIGPATVTPVVTVSSKVYDGTTNATIASRSLLGVIGSDDVVLGTNDVAYFASANVGTAVSVTISNLTLTGSVATNYVLSTNLVTTNANITPATLTYVADPTNRFYGTVNPDFTGSVIGFVNGETLATVTTGILTFTSPATIDSLPGSYPINGSGLAANLGNYVFTQASGNATALTITFNTSPVSLTIDRAPNSIVISWPADHLGWRLQVQTNSVSSGIWTDVAGSTTTNQVIFPSDSLTNGMSVYRLIAPTPTPTPLYRSGLIASNINFGGTFIADSFDSRTNRYSTNGQYDPAKATDHALIASPGLTGFSLGGTAVIRGYVSSQGGLVTSGGSTTVGDFGWVTNHNKGIQPGHFTNGFNINFPPVMAPYGPGTPGVKPATAGTNGVTAYDYMLGGGFYYASNLLSSQFGQTMFVARDSVLVVTGAVDLAQITFNPTNGARLSLFFGYPSVTFTASLVNAKASQFWVYALPSCTFMKITGGTFMGVMYAPGTDLAAEGGANVQGAIVARSFQCIGNFYFHSDDAVAGL